jgi:hypothetical protein
VSELRLDLTEQVFRLPLARIRRLKDGSREAIELAAPMVKGGEVTDIRIASAISECIGVSRLSAITEDDVWAARIAFGMVRFRVRPQTTKRTIQ